MTIRKLSLFALLALAFIAAASWWVFKQDIQSDCQGLFSELLEDNVIEDEYKFENSMARRFNPFFSNFTPLEFSFEKQVNVVCYYELSTNITLEMWVNRDSSRDTMQQKYIYNKAKLITLKQIKPISQYDQARDVNRLWDIESGNQ